MCTFLGASLELRDTDIDKDVIEAADILYLEGYLFDPPHARRAFAKAAALARGVGSSIALSLSDAFVVDRHREALRGFIASQVDILFANESELLSLIETDSLTNAVREVAGLARIIAVTRGAAGSVILADGEQTPIDAFPVAKVVDTTGAGDQYAAGFLLGLAAKRPLKACGALASLAAAEVISHYGPRPQMSLRELAAANGL
jgi:sugar/nucleoside kinase (ribokinase family)